MTKCNARTLRLQSLGRRKVRLDFGAGYVSSDAGVMLLRAVEQRTSILQQVAAGFTDGRAPGG